MDALTGMFSLCGSSVFAVFAPSNAAGMWPSIGPSPGASEVSVRTTVRVSFTASVTHPSLLPMSFTSVSVTSAGALSHWAAPKQICDSP